MPNSSTRPELVDNSMLETGPSFGGASETGHRSLARFAASEQTSPGPNAARTKVVHVGKYYPPHMGGIETHLQALCVELAKSLDVQVMVASDSREPSIETVDGVRVRRIPTNFTFAATPLCPGMISQIRRAECDILHLHFPNPMAVLAFLASGSRARVVATYHSDMVRQKVLGPMFEPLLHAALRRCDAIIVTSPNYLETSQVLRRHRDRCHVIPLGIRTEEFADCKPELLRTIRERYGERLILATGRLVSYKGFEYLVRAMSGVDANLLIVGKGPLHGQLTGLAFELGISGRVHLLGRVDNEQLAACYHAAQIFVLPSIGRNEAFGLVQVEAMYAGLPVVNTQLDSGVPYVSLNEQTGLTVPPRDPEALTAALNRLLDDAELRRRLGDAAKARAREAFSLEAMVSATASLYARVLAGQAGCGRADSGSIAF